MIFDKVLIIDDDDLSIFLMGLTLDDISFIKSYDSVNSGWNALQYLENCDGNSPDLIFVDLNMPEMDGYEFIQHFEERFASALPETRLIVVTSSQRESDRSKSLSYKSVIGFIQKPLEEEKIKEVLEINS